MVAQNSSTVEDTNISNSTISVSSQDKQSINQSSTHAHDVHMRPGTSSAISNTLSTAREEASCKLSTTQTTSSVGKSSINAHTAAALSQANGTHSSNDSSYTTKRLSDKDTKSLSAQKACNPRAGGALSASVIPSALAAMIPSAAAAAGTAECCSCKQQVIALTEELEQVRDELSMTNDIVLSLREKEKLLRERY